MQEKYKYGKYGFVSLTQVVNSYMNDSFNDGRKYFTNILRIAKDAWFYLYRSTLKIPKNKVLPVNKSTNIADIPVDYNGMGRVFIVDECGKLQQLFTDDNINVIDMQIKPDTGCGCTKCNCDNEACAATSQITYTEEDEIINNQTYKKITQRKLCNNGDVIEEVNGYVTKGGETLTIIPYTERRFIAKVEVKPCGCVLNIPDNNKNAFDACGCAVICCYPTKDNQIPVAYNKYGHYKVDTDRGVIHLVGVKEDKIIFTYQSNEQSSEEIMIPEIAVDYIKAAINFRSMRFRANIHPGRIDAAERYMARTEQTFIEDLNPIDLVEVNALKSSHFVKW